MNKADEKNVKSCTLDATKRGLTTVGRVLSYTPIDQGINSPLDQACAHDFNLHGHTEGPSCQNFRIKLIASIASEVTGTVSPYFVFSKLRRNPPRCIHSIFDRYLRKMWKLNLCLMLVDVFTFIQNWKRRQNFTCEIGCANG